MIHKNVEIKAYSTDHESLRNLLHAKNADEKGIDHQIDTYFNVPNGRLKLREGSIENNLIHYFRNNKSGPKSARFTIVKNNPDSGLKKALTDALGILVVIDKKREIFFIDNVKFHIDIVKDLGTFMEIEAIATDESHTEARLLKQCEYFMSYLGIAEEDLLSVSYSDLMLEKNK